MKKLLLDVHCVSDFEEQPDFFLIELDEGKSLKLRNKHAVKFNQRF